MQAAQADPSGRHNDLAAAVPVAQFLRRYRVLLERVRHDSPSTEITVIGVLPVNRTFPSPPNFDNERIIGTNRQLKKLADEFPGIRFLDLAGSLVNDAGNLRREFSVDGLHLNIDGYLAIREALRGPVTEADDHKAPEKSPTR